MLRFNNFTDEYKYFVQGYVLPLMGMSGKPAEFYAADDVKGEIGSSIVVGVVDTGKNKKLYFGSLSRILFYALFSHGFPQDTLKLARCLCRAFLTFRNFSFRILQKRGYAMFLTCTGKASIKWLYNAAFATGWLVRR